MSFECEGFTRHRSGTLIGFAIITTPSRFRFHILSIHRRNGTLLAIPGGRPRLSADKVQMRDAEGKGLWTPVVSFTGLAERARFSAEVIAAIRAAYPHEVL